MASVVSKLRFLAFVLGLLGVMAFGSGLAFGQAISGNLVGSILTNTYYPQLNQGFGQTALTFGTSIGGSAIGFVVSEFLYDGLEYAHLQKLE